MEISEAIKCILDGDAILFVGSGFSSMARKQNGDNLCSAKALSHKLLKECGFEESDYVDDLGQASEIFRAEKGTLPLLGFVKDEFTAASISDEQKFLASLPWYRIYTTNYDNVLEKAFLENGKRLDIAVLSDRQNSFQDKRTLCVCLNGSVSKLSEDKLYEEIKLTNSSYLTDSFKNSPWLNFFQTDLKTAKAIFFVGYSMQYDLDIQRTVYNNSDLKEKTFFIMWEKEPRPNIILVKRFGEVLPIGITAFVEQIKEVQKSYSITKFKPYPMLCFDRIEIGSTIPNIRDKDVFDLFFKGDIENLDKLYYSLISPENIQFCVRRTKLDSIINAVKNGERNIVLHSSLGNGKTFFLASTALLFTRIGYKVFYFKKYRATFSKEVELICNENCPTIVIFDKYTDCIPYIEQFKLFRTDQVLILADRSAMNDIYYGKLVSFFGEFMTENLDKLDNDEIDQFCKILTRYGLWGNKSNLHDDQKVDFIVGECHRSMAKTILQLLHSPNIIGRYRNLIEDVRNKKGFYEAVIYMLIAQVAGFSVDTDDFVGLFDASQLNSPSFKNNAAVREFVDFDGNRVIRTSSLFASVLLEEIFNTDVIVDVMISIFKKLNNQRFRPEVKIALKKMMNYSNLQHILNKYDKNYIPNIHFYYDSIHTLSFCAENPHFWMQYAILKLSVYDYQTAEVYFENAYSFAKKMGDFDTYQIDNHHARFILENEVISGSQITCMKAFTEAHNVLMNPKHKEDTYYYPYRVAQNYYPFYERFYSGMNKNEKQAFISSCVSMLNRIEWYLSSTTTREGRNDVMKAKAFINKILQETGNLNH